MKKQEALKHGRRKLLAQNEAIRERRTERVAELIDSLKFRKDAGPFFVNRAMRRGR